MRSPGLPLSKHSLRALSFSSCDMPRPTLFTAACASTSHANNKVEDNQRHNAVSEMRCAGGTEAQGRSRPVASAGIYSRH